MMPIHETPQSPGASQGVGNNHGSAAGASALVTEDLQHDIRETRLIVF